jgi:hypothetical protein
VRLSALRHPLIGDGCERKETNPDAQTRRGNEETYVANDRTALWDAISKEGRPRIDLRALMVRDAPGGAPHHEAREFAWLFDIVR